MCTSHYQTAANSRTSMHFSNVGVPLERNECQKQSLYSGKLYNQLLLCEYNFSGPVYEAALVAPHPQSVS